MNGILFDSQPFWGSREIANLVGVNGAIAIQQIHFWCNKNKENNRNFHKGRYWTYNTYEDWQENCLTWLSVSGIKKCLTTLEKDGYIVSDNFNIIRTDRTKWYAINYDKLSDDVAANEQRRLEAKRAKEQSRIDTKCLMEQIPSVPSIPKDTYQINTEKEFSVINSENAVSDLYVKCARDSKLPAYDGNIRWAVKIVDEYINEWYQEETGKRHIQIASLSEYADRLVECQQILEHDRGAETEPEDFEKALKTAVKWHDCKEPTIMWATSPKVLGYWLVESGVCYYQDVMGTKYGFSDDAEKAYAGWDIT